MSWAVVRRVAILVDNDLPTGVNGVIIGGILVPASSSAAFLSHTSSFDGVASQWVTFPCSTHAQSHSIAYNGMIR